MYLVAKTVQGPEKGAIRSGMTIAPGRGDCEPKDGNLHRRSNPGRTETRLRGEMKQKAKLVAAAQSTQQLAFSNQPVEDLVL